MQNGDLHIENSRRAQYYCLYSAHSAPRGKTEILLILIISACNIRTIAIEIPKMEGLRRSMEAPCFNAASADGNPFRDRAEGVYRAICDEFNVPA
jgi:hypothetical protein